MGYCAWTSLCEYINAEVGDGDLCKYTPLSLATAAEMFDRVCNVFGWTMVNRATRVKDQAKGQTLLYELQVSDTRSRRFLRCCLIDQRKFPHDCNRFRKDFWCEGDYEAAIKIDKKTLVDWTRDLRRYYAPRAQGPPVTSTGDNQEIQDDGQNTALLTDLVLEKEEQKIVQEDWISERSSTEKVYEFPEILDRWIPLKKIEIKQAMSTGLVAKYLLPTDLAGDSCVSNVFPFEQFAYGLYEFEFQLHCTSNPRQAGRVLVASTPDPIGLHEEYFKDWAQLVQRQHAWVDFASGSTASLTIPFEFHRGMVRNLDHGQNTAGIRGGVSVRIDVALAAPLRIGANQEDSLTLVPFVKLRKAKFAGMGFKVPIAQGPITDKIRSYKQVIDQADTLLRVVGETTGLDKPIDPTLSSVVTPVPRMHFACGKGVTDASVLKLSHFQTTTMPTRVKQQIKHTTISDITSQLGLIAAFQWKTAYTQGVLLKALYLSPCEFVNPLSDSVKFPTWIPPPLSFNSSMYQLWTGTMDMSFVFPATDQHKGKLLCTIEFTRTASDQPTEMCQSYAAYHVVFDLGENRRFDVTIPYIYDTPWRRCNNVPLSGHYKLEDVKAGVKYRTGLLQNINTRLTLKVVNPLRCNNTVSAEIDCLIFVKAGQDYNLHGLIQQNQLLPSGAQPNSFPYGYDALMKVRATRTTDPTFKLKSAAHQYKNLGDIVYASSVVDALGEEEKKKFEKEIADLQQKVKECESKKQEISVKQAPTSSQNKDLEYVRAFEAAMAHWAKENTSNRIGHKLSDSWKRDIDTRANEPTPEYIVEHQALVQDAQYGGPYFVGGSAWKTAARTGNLLTTMRWVPIARAQGFGDRETHPVKFGPKTSVSSGVTLTPTVEESLWTVLRAPIQIQRQKKITPMGQEASAYFIPLIPPQWTYIKYDENKDAPALFDSMAIMSPHVAITSQFRFWRGSMRYIIIAYDATAPIYITYLPHSGTRIIGQKSLKNDKDVMFSQLTVGMSGNRTEMLIPGINSTAHVEVPYISENVWATMNNGRVNENWFWRDKGDDNAGHLVLSSEKEVVVDVWWAAGDDFRVAGYLGTITTQRPRAADALSDDHPRAQADFRVEEGKCLEHLPSAQIDIWTPVSTTIGTVTGAFSIGNAIGMRNFLRKSEPLLGKTDVVLTTMTESLIKTQGVLDILTTTSEKVPQAIENIASQIVSVFNNVTSATLTTVTVVKGLLDVYVCWQTKNTTVIVSTLVRWLLDLGLIATNHVAEGIKVFMKMFTMDDVPRAQAERDSYFKEFYTFLLQTLGIFMKFSRYRICAVIKFLTSNSTLRNLTFSVKSLQFLFEFLEGLVNAVADIWYYFVGFSDPEAKLANALQNGNDILLNFVADVHFFLRPESKKLLQVSPKARLRYYGALQVSYMMKKLLLKTTSKNQHQELSRLIDKLHKFNVEMFEDISSSPVRFEPYVVCLHGESAIGKSYLSTELVTELLAVTNWPKDINPIYIRTPGKDFWDGYAGQPVVVFDDLHNVNEVQSNVNTIADIYALKSSAVFNPNMAKLEEKNMKANPLLVIMLTNVPFFTSAEMNSYEAYYRRRDLVVKVTMEGEHQEDFSHLTFEKYQKKIPTAEYPEGQLTGISLNYQQFLRLIKDEWKQYYTKEVKNVNFRWKHFMKCLERESEEHLLEFDPYVLMTKHLFDTATASGQSKEVTVEMDLLFEKFLAHEKKESAVDLFINDFKTELTKIGREQTERGPHAQLDVEELRSIFGEQAQIVANVIRAKMCREANDIFIGTKNEAEHFSAAVVYEHIVAALTKLCSLDFLTKVGEICGFEHGVCSHCKTRGQVLVERCDKVHDENCNHAWCSRCVTAGIPHGNKYICQSKKLMKFYYVLKQVIATIALTFTTTVGYVCISLISMLNAAFNVLKGFGYYCILYSFFYFLTGSFWAGAKALGKGLLIQAWLSCEAAPLWDEVFAHDFFTSFTGLTSYIIQIIWMWKGNGPKAIKAQADTQGHDIMDHVLGYKEVDQTKAKPLQSYPPLYGMFEAMERLYPPPDGWFCPHNQMLYKIEDEHGYEWHLEWRGVLDQEHRRWVSPDGKTVAPLGPCGNWCILYEEGIEEPILESLGLVCEHGDLVYSVDHINPTVEWKGEDTWMCSSHNSTHLSENRPCKHPLCPLRYAFIVTDLLKIVKGSQEFEAAMDEYCDHQQRVKNLPYQLFSYEANLAHKRPYYHKLYTWLQYFQKIQKACVWQFTAEGFFKTLSKILIVVALLVGSLYSVYKLVVKVFGVKQVHPSTPFTWEQVARAEASSQYDPGSPRRARNPNRRPTQSRLNTRAQGAYENSMSIAALIMRNMIQIHITTMSSKTLKLNGLGVFDHTVLLPRHYYTVLKPLMGQQVLVSMVLQGDRCFPAQLVENDFILDELNDLMYWQAPPTVGLFANITKHFASEEFYASAAITGQGFMMIPPIRNMPIPTIQGLQISEIVTQQKVQGLDGEFYEVLDTVTYNFSMDGACGSPVLRTSSKNPLVGIHVAGSGEGVYGTGYALIITQEMIQACKHTPKAQFDIPVLKCLDEGVTAFEEDVNIIELGSVERGMAVIQPKETKIIPSAIAQDLGVQPVRIPAPLGPNEGIYSGKPETPLTSGCAHHSCEVLDIGSECEKEVGDYLVAKYEGISPIVVQPKVLTPEQTVTGLKNIDYYDPMDLRTSPGWPYNKKRDGDKHAWINVERDEDEYPVKANIDVEVLQTVEEKMKQRSEGVVPHTVFADVLKDEKRKRSKLKEMGSTRIICMSPLDFTITVRMFFLHFMAMFMSNRIKLRHAVGISPDGPEWGHLVRKLKAKNPENCWTLDYTNFGPGFSPRAGSAAYRVMLEWTELHVQLTTSERKALRSMKYELLQSTHICNDLIYQQTCGSPSGAALTVVINSIVNEFYLMWAMREILLQQNKVSKAGVDVWNVIDENVQFFTYGDDVIAATTPAYIDVLNAATISKFLLNYKIVSTDAAKGVLVKPYGSYATTFSFLKRGLQPHPKLHNEYLAPVEWYVVEEAAFYCHKSGNFVENTIENANASLILAFGHGEEKFNEWRRVVNKALVKRNIPPLSVTWQDLNNLFFPNSRVYSQAVQQFEVNYRYKHILVQDNVESNTPENLLKALVSREPIPILPRPQGTRDRAVQCYRKGFQWSK